MRLLLCSECNDQPICGTGNRCQDCLYRLKKIRVTVFRYSPLIYWWGYKPSEVTEEVGLK